MIEVKLHDIGEGMTEGDVLTYLVKKGDPVDVDQPLVEVQTEKMVAELTSPVTGIVKDILIDTGKTIAVGTTVMTVEAKENANPFSHNESMKESAPAAETIIQTDKTHLMEKPKHNRIADRVKAAPYTRKIARQHQVDLKLVKGTGRGGRITVEDVYRFIENRDNTGLDPSAAANLVIDSQTPIEKRPEAEQTDVIPFKGRRKQIAIKMAKSLYTIPHVSHFEEIDMTNLLDYRKELKALNVNISAVAFFLKALALSLKDYPVFNAKLDEEKEVIKLEKEVHMGLATDSDEGLIVPVLRNVEKKSLRTIHDEMKELTKKAQENRLTVKEMTGSTFTISNVGPMGSIGATPIINFPETGLMAFHKTKKMPVVNEQDEIVIRSMMNVTLAFDHRVADGGTAVAFTNRFKSLIENPKLLTLELV
ncbi:dihydrolipoamide acetyltransferase family protein [Pseudobacillus wudalianchiensis]|uniref:Dihydrolipoamide acetyltransferase component of pyruvate dehydrogenase complex n=1 Tax=Pseudobacillus wudalianchiensis TaxID=1743143 RepID=A0A1B9B6W5_9BACI|nr:dihydrolipoamide acetyltransferase family protein [Bacillus wudalianchiensis]OCA91799.1 dihydrolipoyllysine acetyltransferase [Bacillus wudalianchiensis]